MNIKILGKNKDSELLFDKVNNILEELWLNDFIKVKKTTSSKLKKEFNIKKEPALIVEEESINFTDIIFEWIIPNDEKLKSIFINIIGWWNDLNGCDTSDCWICWVC